MSHRIFYNRRIISLVLTLLLALLSTVYSVSAESTSNESKISIYIRVYPREVVLDADAIIIPGKGFMEIIKRLTFTFSIDNLYNVSEGSLIVEASYREIEIPFNIAATLNFTDPSGGGWLHIFFLRPADFQGLQEARLDFIFTLREAALIDLDASFNASIVIEYASSDFLKMIEEAEELSKTEAGMEIIKQRVREYLGELLSLRDLKLHFSRDEGLLTGSVKMDVNASAVLSKIMQAVPGAPKFQIEMIPRISKLYLTLSIDRASARIYMVWRLNERIEQLLSGLQDLSGGIQLTLTRFLIGVRRSFRIEVSYIIAEGKMRISVRGMKLVFREEPEDTFNAVMEILRDVEVRNPGLIEKITIAAGSDQNYEAVIWHSGSTHKVLEFRSPHEFSGSMTIAKNKWGIADYEVYTKSIQIEGSSYTITAASNSTVTNIVLWDKDKLAFNVEGRDGTLGALNATIPRAVLGGADPKSIKVTAGGVDVENAIINVGQDVIWIYVTYIHNVYAVMVKWILPQQAALATQMLLLIAAGAIAGAIIGIIIVVKRK